MIRGWTCGQTGEETLDQEAGGNRSTTLLHCLTLHLLPPRSSNYPYILFKARVALEGSNPNHYFLVRIHWFPETDICYFLSLSHINNLGGEREEILQLKSSKYIHSFKQKPRLVSVYTPGSQLRQLRIPAWVSD